MPASGPNATSGSKALCFCGNNNLVYKQTNSVTLPAGSYKMTVNIYAYNGAYSSVQPTTKIKTFTGFVDNDGTEYFSEERSDNNEIVLNSNAWNQEVVYFELAKATTGHIQVSYGAQYFVVVDDIRLEGESGVVTSQLPRRGRGRAPSANRRRRRSRGSGDRWRMAPCRCGPPQSARSRRRWR